MILILAHLFAEARYVAQLAELPRDGWCWLSPNNPTELDGRRVPQVWRVSCWSAGLAFSRQEELLTRLAARNADIRDVPCPHSGG